MSGIKLSIKVASQLADLLQSIGMPVQDCNLIFDVLATGFDQSDTPDQVLNELLYNSDSVMISIHDTEE